jgi:hypothetical protein
MGEREKIEREGKSERESTEGEGESERGNRKLKKWDRESGESERRERERERERERRDHINKCNKPCCGWPSLSSAGLQMLMHARPTQRNKFSFQHF